MSRKMVPVMSVKRWISALCLTAILIPLLGCATTPPIVTTPPIAEMAWVRTDGRKIADDPALLQQGRSVTQRAHQSGTESGRGISGNRSCCAQLVDVASLPSDAEIRPEWDAFLAALNRPASQKRIKALMERGFHRPGDVENRLGFYVGQIGG